MWFRDFLGQRHSKLKVWSKHGSRHKKLNSRSRGFNSRAFYANVRLVLTDSSHTSILSDSTKRLSYQKEEQQGVREYLFLSSLLLSSRQPIFEYDPLPQENLPNFCSECANFHSVLEYTRHYRKRGWKKLCPHATT